MFEDKKLILEQNIKEKYKKIIKIKDKNEKQDKYLEYYNAKEEYKNYVIQEEKEIEELRERIRNSYKYQVALSWVEFCEKTGEKIIDVYKKLSKKR